ncbi:MAG: glycosyltransferase [Clostridia bacterium]|nr:glycosyltransferase [Clostridia bacterium]
MRIAWEGPFFRPLSLDKVNREMASRLLERGHEVLLLNTDVVPEGGPPADPRIPRLLPYVTGPQPADVHVRHAWPPRFGDRLGPLFLWQPWEFGAVPESWVEAIATSVHRLVVPSQAVREMYEVSGVAPEKMAVVPLGVDPSVYNPWGPKAELPGARSRVLLFVGGLIPRKGVDVLLKAYAAAFTRKDDVTLVLKTTSTRVYDEREMRRRVAELQDRANAPHVMLLETDLNEPSMAALYRASHLVVSPYRGEGFNLPVLEAMASGTLVLVSDTAPTAEFASHRTVVPIPGRRIYARAPYSPKPAWHFEPDVEALAELLREWVNADGERVARRTAQAVATAHIYHTWWRSVEAFLDLIREVVPAGPPGYHPRRPSVPKPVAGSGTPPVRWIRLFRPGERVLQVGCAGGEILDRLAAAGVEAVGLEDDPAAAELCARRGFDVLVGEAAELLERLATQGPLWDGVGFAEGSLPADPAARSRVLNAACACLRLGGRLALPIRPAPSATGEADAGPWPSGALREGADLPVELVEAYSLEPLEPSGDEAEDRYWLLRRPGRDPAAVPSDGSPVAPGGAPAAARVVVWRGPIRNASGYAAGAREVLKALPQLGWLPRVVDQSGEAPSPLDGQEEEYFRLLESVATPPDAPMVHNVPGYALFRRRRGLEVARTMFETDRLPPSWVERIREMDAVFVPTSFNVETFERSGVPARKLHVVPEPVDTDLFRPRAPSPDPSAPTDPGRLFTFVSVMDWQERKGWPELVRAWAAAFRKSDPVRLLIKVTKLGAPVGDIWEQIRNLLRTLGKSVDDCAPLRILDATWSAREVAEFYRMGQAFVLPTRGEGWGRPIVEAMASGLPVLVTNWSAPATYLDESCALLLRYRLETVHDDFPLAHFRGHRWAVADVEHLAERMRWVVEHPEEAALLGRRARAVAEQWNSARVAAIYAELLERLAG